MHSIKEFVWPSISSRKGNFGKGGDEAEDVVFFTSILFLFLTLGLAILSVYLCIMAKFDEFVRDRGSGFPPLLIITDDCQASDAVDMNPGFSSLVRLPRCRVYVPKSMLTLIG